MLLRLMNNTDWVLILDLDNDTYVFLFVWSKSKDAFLKLIELKFEILSINMTKLTYKLQEKVNHLKGLQDDSWV